MRFQFAVGDKVVITEDAKKAEELQAGYGGWIKPMAKVLYLLDIVCTLSITPI